MMGPIQFQGVNTPSSSTFIMDKCQKSKSKQFNVFAQYTMVYIYFLIKHDKLPQYLKFLKNKKSYFL